MWGEYKNVDLLEYVWNWMTISLQQVRINILELHGDHKSKTYNRYTKTIKKGTQAHYKRKSSNHKRKNKEEKMNKEELQKQLEKKD